MWTEDRIELLKKHWAEGLSASQIAARLGGVTRNAVIGKVHRLGLEQRRPRERLFPRKAVVLNLPVKPTRIQMPSPRVTGNLALKAEPVIMSKPKPVVVASAEPASFPPAPILAIGPRQCRFPHGEPGERTFGFCGHNTEAGSAYCPHHHRRVFNPPTPMRPRKPLPK